MPLSPNLTARTHSSKRHLSLAAILLALAAACAAPAGPRPMERFPSLRPGDPRISAARPSGAECFNYMAFAPGDTTGRVLGPLTVEWGEHGTPRHGPAWVRSAYAAQTEDTMVYDAGSLAPSREQLRVGRQRVTLRYRGATVERTVEHGDTVEPLRTATFDRPVFGFNQRELLLRVVRLQPGDTVILPLYSEIDAALELDTIALATPPLAPSPDGRIAIRFADPAIVAIVTVDTMAHRILGEEIRNRRRPALIRRTLIAPAQACTG